MPEHEHIPCERCGRTIECKVGTILECQCFEVELSPAESDHIRWYYEGCLCQDCMVLLRDRYRSRTVGSG